MYSARKNNSSKPCSTETFMALLSSPTAASSSVSVTCDSHSLRVPTSHHAFTPSPSIPSMDSPSGFTPEVNLFDNSFDGECLVLLKKSENVLTCHFFATAAFSSSSPSDFDLLSSFGTPFGMPAMVNGSALSFSSVDLFNVGFQAANGSSAAAKTSTSLAGVASSPSPFPSGFDFMSTFGTPLNSSMMDVPIYTLSNNSSVVGSNNVSSPAVNGSLAEIMFSPSFSTSSPNDFSSFGIPFPASSDVPSALSNNIGSVVGSNNVYFSAGSGSSMDSINWLDSLSVPVAAASVAAAPIKKSKVAKPARASGPSSHATSITSKGNRETAVSSVYTSKVSGNKQTVEHPCSCKVCGVAMATMVLRGSVDSFLSGYLIDVTCDACTLGGASPSASPAPEIPNLKIVQSRKRARKVNDNGKAVHCDVCQAHVGSGGVQVIDADANKRFCGESSAAARKSDSFTVEVVCAGCRDLFGFCTECGGGGKYRTGKYRPFELFQEGRRTCSLPHFRLGDTKATHSFVAVSTQAAAALAEAKVIFADSFMSHHAIPKEMTGPTAAFPSAAAIQQSADALWSKEEARVAASYTPGQYVAFASIPKSSRKKARTSTGPSESSEIQMACFTAEHSVNEAVLEVKQVATRVTAAQSSTLLADMVCNAVACLGFGSVHHVLVSGAVLTPAQIEKLGAVSVDAYLASVPMSAGCIYLRQRAVEESMIGAELFVVAAARLV
ncbi:UNVERIFIED_CONTAM: hypothetical protein HDU68_001971 [Siphonaria sp. JEL0065]|nr:hypothetical protein HDU68_001971 [Siphonaria sp. JEL0065]